jgi:hypothetical protein
VAALANLFCCFEKKEKEREIDQDARKESV